MNVGHLVAEYGYLAVLAFVLLESLGVPVPGETALVAAGIYAGHTHALSVVGIWAVASAGAIAGGTLGYLIGVQGGYRLVHRYGAKVHIDERKLKVGRYAFARYGERIVFFGRFVVVLRTYAAFLAGTNKMPWRRFTVANTAGALIWSAIWAFVSYAVGDAMRHVSTTVNYVLLGLGLVVIAASLLLVRRKSRQLVEVAEAAYPGPLER